MGTMYTDPVTFIILPVDEVEQILKPPADILPQFDPAVDFFGEYDQVADFTSLVFLPKAQDDPERIVAVTLYEEIFPINFSGDLVMLDISEGEDVSMVFLTADNQKYVVIVEPKWSSVPEPSTMILLGVGLLGMFGVVTRRRKKARCLAKHLLVLSMTLFLFAGNVQVQATACQVGSMIAPLSTPPSRKR